MAEITDLNGQVAVSYGFILSSYNSSTAGAQNGTAGPIFDRLSHRRTYRSLVVAAPYRSTGTGTPGNRTLTIGALLEDADSTAGPFAAVPQLDSTAGTRSMTIPAINATSTAAQDHIGAARFGFDLTRARRYLRVTPSVTFGATSSGDAVNVGAGALVFSIADERPGT